MQRSTRRALVGAAAAVVAAGVGAAGLTAAGAEEPAPAAPYALPEPTGGHTVGTEVLHLVDEDRADPWFPDEDRQLMVTMWFPTDDSGETAPYMTAEESALFIDQLGDPAPSDYFATVETNSVAGADPIRGKLPLVVLSPGWSFPRATLTGLAEELASHGYAVAAVGHNYESPLSLPGETNPCLACELDPDGPTVAATRADDLSFVVDELTARGSEWRRHIDRGDIMAGGHSMGGASAHVAVQEDERFDAGFNLDGSMHDEVAPVDVPFLLLGNAENAVPGADDSWTSAWAQMNDWKRWIRVEQTTHSSFTDLAPLAKDLGIPLQEMDGERALDLTRAYVLAFADQELRGDDAPLLDGPSTDWPEAVFHNP
ncbi:alpha/beta hydrolase family protein [Glycomyces terrestris]|uniref:Alpha/beta hydrolase n=1 Tax=Glycomyces terrestris TaxID=2493553 RepID=A0A426UTJ8_9ACTN|nr:alpha/beta hydrolase [Glycomyces terrestris]RRR97334.1 alpha/beta hydrolase [Glycomyces terrestris]